MELRDLGTQALIIETVAQDTARLTGKHCVVLICDWSPDENPAGIYELAYVACPPAERTERGVTWL